MSFENEIRRTNKRKKKKNTVLIAGYAIVAALCLLVMVMLGAFGNKKNNDVSSLNVSSEISSVTASSEIETVSSTQSVSSAASSIISSKNSSVSVIKPSSTPGTTSSSTSNNINTEEKEAYIPKGDWRLVIANKKFPLPRSFVVNVNTVYLPGNYRIDSRIKDAYNSMISAAKKDGVSLNLISGYRTYDGQTQLFNRKVNDYISQGNSKAKATELAAQYVAPPGTSEHHTGLAVDLISPDWYSKNRYLTAEFDQTKQFSWLYSHCAEYGFILRYPKDKEAITGYSYEPWHYRYVGVEIAKEIMSRKICLEEYVAGL